VTDETQISATVSSATRDRLDRFAQSRGLKKNDVVEQALLFFMQAHRELPDEATFDRLAEALERPPAPTRALRELMRGRRR
jgi:uncharacterized protein (DUF1778 family)